ncbi:Plasma membrane fusion protein prm1 [Smittium mucronatum]|uniref:Plasma membrane fusion protein PRM1 n=1 Tax=Smittium mucronatum TaxID=133383 RepID=A0A1R0GT24_9FUNG|nr:Plasma membrane fusion protein prm1 [Smittium mucronatum]
MSTGTYLQKSVPIIPYVSLRGRMTKSIASLTVVVLVIHLVGLVQEISSLKALSIHTKSSINDTCHLLSDSFTALLNSPGNLMNKSITNIQDLTNESLKDAAQTLLNIASLSGNLIELIVKIYIGTTICLLRVIVESSLDIISDTAKDFESAAQSLLNSTLSTITAGITTVTGGLQQAASGLDSLFEKSNATGLAALSSALVPQNLTIDLPTNWIDKIDAFKEIIPTEDQLYSKLANFTSAPFVAAATKVSTFVDSHTLSFNNSLQYQSMSISLCPNNLADSIVDPLYHAIRLVMVAGIIVFAILILIVILFNCLIIRKQFYCDLVGISKLDADIDHYTSTHNPLNQSPPSNNPGLLQKFRLFNQKPSDSFNPSTAIDEYHSSNLMYTPTKSTSTSRDSFESFALSPGKTIHPSYEKRRITSILLRPHVVPPSTPKSLSDFNPSLLDMYYCSKSHLNRVIKSNSQPTSKKHLLVRWFFHYIYEPSIISLFIIGFFGLSIAITQRSIVSQIINSQPQTIHTKISTIKQNFQSSTIEDINQNLANFAIDANNAIQTSVQTLNYGIAGISASATSLNSTLDSFVDEYTSIINSTLGNTIFATPVLGYVNCILTNRIRTVQSLLTFVDIPQIRASNLTIPSINQPIDPLLDFLQKIVIGTTTTATSTPSLPPPSTISNSTAKPTLRKRSTAQFGGYSGGLIKLLTDPVLDSINKKIAASWVLLIPWSLVILMGTFQVTYMYFIY